MFFEDPDPADLVQLIEQQARRIGMKTVPVVLYCSRVAVPTVVGVLKPVVLLPASLIVKSTLHVNCLPRRTSLLEWMLLK